MRSRANRDRTCDGNAERHAFEREDIPARPAWHVYLSCPARKVWTRRSTSPIGGVATDTVIARAWERVPAASDRIQPRVKWFSDRGASERRPLIVWERVPDCREPFLERWIERLPAL